MLNRSNDSFSGLAKLEYGDSEFMVIKPGAHVLCAETGKQIQLHNLSYWSAELQEAYINADAATTRWKTMQDGS
ncbi:hypothetical protein MNBD_ALPHA06-276 [hydrothermal vent metagenome]|uniref:DUF2093 domain-containing protein n=1 Tax=hydrothermal vent metagenome TaxID=652676 RepID=A0A3B0SZ62_9ZZZZ